MNVKIAEQWHGYQTMGKSMRNKLTEIAQHFGGFVIGLIIVIPFAYFLFPLEDVPSKNVGGVLNDSVLLSSTGKEINYAYCDDQTGEDLIICTETENFIAPIARQVANRPQVNLIPEARVNFSVRNTGQKQNVTIVLSVGGKTQEVKIWKAKGSINEVAVTQIGERPASQKAKSVVGELYHQSGSFNMNANETAYFQANIKTSLGQDESEDFTIEAYGDNGAYGNNL